MKPMSKGHGSKLIKLKGDKLLSNFAFNFNLRSYTAVDDAQARRA